MKEVQVKLKTALLLMATLLIFASNTVKATPNLNNIQKCDIPISGPMLENLNKEYKDYTHKISRRKKLIVKKISSVCLKFDNGRPKVVIKVDVKLSRKFRRDGNGHIDIIAELKFDGDYACLYNSKLKTLKLSRTLRIGEHIYKSFAGQVIKDNTCFKYK